MTKMTTIELNVTDTPIERARKAWLFMDFANDRHNQIGKLAEILDGYYQLDTAVQENSENETINPRDWPEDFDLENGNYSNTCIGCAENFTGYKRRTLCKVCYGKHSSAEGDTPDE